jgi:hypothetical protein
MIVKGSADFVIGGILPPKAPGQVLRAVAFALDTRFAGLGQDGGIIAMDL